MHVGPHLAYDIESIRAVALEPFRYARLLHAPTNEDRCPLPSAGAPRNSLFDAPPEPTAQL
eukprot:6908535-Lingulodinium_polyedra.AAC.1